MSASEHDLNQFASQTDLVVQDLTWGHQLDGCERLSKVLPAGRAPADGLPAMTSTVSSKGGVATSDRALSAGSGEAAETGTFPTDQVVAARGESKAKR